MALTNSQMLLIRSIAENDMKAAKKFALICCEEDSTQKNAGFTNRYKDLLKQSESKIIKLPSDISGFVSAEDVSQTFNEKRYFLSERERPISKRIMNMANVARKLKEMSISYRNATLLYGESGVGKTTFGRYIAYKSELLFCYLNFSMLIDSYMGGTSKNISKAFAFVAESPCVFMLDEIDTICENRSSRSNNGCDKEYSRITVTIMQELDKLSNDVILLAATNRLDRIDSAILRRFSVKHEVKPLNDDEKVEMLDVFLKDVGVDFSGEKINAILSESTSQSEIINRAIEGIAADILSDLEKGKGDNE
ncbi:MAG: AAA family ATPase [Oscillospiraceae bacterium]